MHPFLEKHSAFDHCKALLPWFSHARSASAAARFRRKAAQIENKGRHPSRLIAAPLHAAVSLRQMKHALSEHGSLTAHHYGVGHVRQLAGLLRLCWLHNHPPHDYYQQKLWLRKDSKHWGSYIQHREHVALIDRLKTLLPVDKFDNKLQLYHHLKAAEVPTIPVLMVAQNGRWLPDFSTKPGDKALRQDLIVKPADGAMNDSVETWRYDATRDRLTRKLVRLEGKAEVFLGEQTFTCEDWCARILELSAKRTYMIQGREVNTPEMERLSPENVANFRIITTSSRDGIRIVAAILRLSYDITRWAPSVYFAQINLETGELGMATGNLSQWGYEERHLDTGCQIKGHVCSNWPALAEVALRAHAVFPWMPAIGWDIIDTPSGPKVMEGNACWGADIVQVGDTFLGETNYPEAVLEALELAESKTPA